MTFREWIRKTLDPTLEEIEEQNAILKAKAERSKLEARIRGYSKKHVDKKEEGKKDWITGQW